MRDQDIMAKPRQCVDFQINLLRDLADVVRQQLAVAGHDVASVVDDDLKALVFWHKWNRYKIPSRPRIVLKASGFDSLGHEVGLSRLEAAIQQGQDLSGYMTSRLSDITASDGLLDHWDIYHFHLGTEDDPRTGGVKRTRDILLCRIDQNHAYFIKVAPHGSGSPPPWYQQELIDIIHRNWPQSIEYARLRGVTGISPNYNDDDARELRNANVITFVQVEDGTVYMPPGMGTTGDGTHTDDLTFADNASRSVAQIEKYIVDGYASIKDNARCLGFHFREPVSFVLGAVQLGNYWDVREVQTGYRFRVVVQRFRPIKWKAKMSARLVGNGGGFA